MLIKIKVGDKSYQLDRLTLGDGAYLKRQFGLTDLEKFNPGDPETLLGLITLAVAKTDGIDRDKALAIAEDLDFESVDMQSDQVEPDPTPAAADSAATEPLAVSGDSVTILPAPGIPA